MYNNVYTYVTKAMRRGCDGGQSVTLDELSVTQLHTSIGSRRPRSGRVEKGKNES